MDTGHQLITRIRNQNIYSLLIVTKHNTIIYKKIKKTKSEFSFTEEKKVKMSIIAGEEIMELARK